MRKLFYLVISIVIFGLIISGCFFHVVPPLSQDGSIDIVKDDVSYKTNLIAGQHTIAGSITVSNDDENLFIIYETVDSWLLNKTHLYIGQTVPTNSAPGQFSYKHENLAGVSTDSYEIPLVDLWVGFSDTVYIAAHAELTKEGQKEGGWAEGVEIRPGKDWAMYFEYQLSWDEFSDYEKIAITTDRAIHEFVANCEIYGEEQAKQMIIDSLLGKEGVINAGIGIDNESIWFQWENGIISSFSEFPEQDEQQIGFSRFLDDSGILTYSKDARNTPENNKAIIFDWEHTQESTVKVRMIEDFLNDKGYVPTYRSRSESTFTLYELENINDYGVIYIDSHAFADGVHGVKILTGQEGMPFTPEYDEVCAYFKGKYGTDNFISTHSFYKKKWFGLVEEYIGRFYCFYPGFIEAIAKYKSFPKSLAYADACYSYADTSMAAAFTDSGGAYAYCGYSGTTYAECKTDYLTFQYLLVDGMDLEAAIDKAHLNTNLPILCWGLNFYPEDNGDLFLVNGGTGPVHNLTKGTYYTTIQAALDDADSNDSIEVSEGTYNENINFNGKNITLLSTNTNDPDVVASTIIDGGENGSVVIFTGGETRQAVLRGLTIQNGNSEPGAGGGIMINNSSPTISGNIIRWNTAHSDHGGGGIFIAHSASPLIEDNTINGNQGGFGGGIYVGDNSSPTIRNNTLENNSAEIHRGGGIFISGSSSPTIQDNSLSGNSSQYGGGICIVENSSGEISNNYFTQNTAQYGGGIFCGEESDLIIKQNEFSGNSAKSFGGGLFIGESSPHLTGNIIESNSSQTGGGIFVWESSPTISDNIISGNTTTMSGGGIYVRSNSHPTINNNIISLNTTTRDGGGLYIDSNSSVKTTNGSTWPRQNTPPNTEATNTYFGNTHGNPLDYTEGADVYMVGAITPPQIIEPPIEFFYGVAVTYHSTRSKSITRDISNDDSVTVLYYSGNLSDALSKGSINNAIDVTWSAYDNCTGYRVYRSKNSSEYSIILDWDTSGIISNWFGLYDSDVEIGNTYRYYVTAHNDTEKWETVPSNIYTIDINNETFLPPIYLIQPPDYGIGGDPNYLFKWIPVGNILPYGDVVEGKTWLRIFDADTLSSLWTPLYSDNFTTSQVTYNGNPLISGNTYRWYVRNYGLDANGQIIASSESEVWEFTYIFNVTPVPDTPTLYDLSYCPLSGADYDLTWSDESSNWADGYEIQESKYSDFRSICGGESTLSTSATFNHSVTESTSYFYRVRSVNNYNNASGWSNTVEVMVESSTPPPDAPVLYNLFYNPSSGASYDLTWSDESISGAAGYEIEESKYSDFRSISSGASTMYTSWTFGNDVTEDTSYYYRVRSMSSEGVYSEEWSNIVEVMVEAIPKASISVITRDHNSNLIYGGISYILYDDSNPWNAICNSGSSSSNSYTFDDLEAGTYNIESYKYNDYSLQGYYAAKVNISLSEGQNKSITIYTSAIAVCLVDSNNNFIPSDGLEYVLYLEDGSGNWRYIKTVAAPSNNYTFTKIPSGIYNVEAYTNGDYRGTAVDIYVAPKVLVPRIIVAN